MLIQVLQTLFTRDINRVMGEIKQYPDETLIWKTEKAISNSAGNLCLHLCGNLNHFIGHVLGGTDYVRNRPLEFSAKDVPVSHLLRMLEEVSRTVTHTLQHLDPSRLEETFPEQVFDEPLSTGHMLMHLSTHLSYHLGQINYHRRLLTGK